MHILLGALLFVLLAAPTLGLWELTKWIEGFGAPWWLADIFHGLAAVLLAVDLMCAVFFILVEAARFLREVWNNRYD
ncbi:MAG TPA: hypothetical protein VG889_17255 [Rhizomicrobium sp.]|nr:hypothetical protein [Rhizomicrobium sp.]